MLSTRGRREGREGGTGGGATTWRWRHFSGLKNCIYNIICALRGICPSPDRGTLKPIQSATTQVATSSIAGRTRQPSSHALPFLLILLRVTQILCRFMGTLVVNAATTATSRRRSSSVIKNSWLTEWRTEVSFHWFPFRLRPVALPPFPCWIM